MHKAGGPVFLMIGGEGEANPVWMSQGTWIDYAREFGALCFQLEHRYISQSAHDMHSSRLIGDEMFLLCFRFYGKSHPTSDMSVKNLSFLSSEQALADLASFIAAMNEVYHLPIGTRWISFGGSYPGRCGGMDVDDLCTHQLLRNLGRLASPKVPPFGPRLRLHLGASLRKA